MAGIRRLKEKLINAVLIFLLAVVFLVVSYISYQSLLRIDTDEAWVIHSYQVSTNIGVLLSDLENMETSDRGYIIAGQDIFLEPYNTALPKIYPEFQSLQELTKDNSAEQQRLSLMKPLIDERLAEFQTNLALRRDKGLDAAIAAVSAGTGKETMDAIRTIVADMQTDEASLLQARTQDLTQVNHSMESTIVWGAIIGLLLYLLVNYVISKFVMGNLVEKPLLERERQALFYARSLIEASLDPLVTISPEGKITDVNEAVTKVTEVPRGELIGTDFSEYFTEPQKARDGYEQAFKFGTVTDYPLTIKSKTGRLTDVLYNASVYKNEEDKILGVFAAARDYTLAKKAMEETAKANKEMEAFSYSVSHDLRAPLRAIDGFTQILVEDYGAKLDDEGRRVASIIRASTVQMGHLIDDLLSFSRLGRQEVKKSPVDMRSLVGEVYAEIKKSVPARKIDFTVKELPSANADVNMMRVVWTNLLSNAVKFTGKKENAIIEVGSTSDNNEITYYVKDNGAGFDMKYMDKLFGVFQRLHSVEEFEGTGVGLANVKRVVERHGGRAWAEAKVGEGATFYFTLPKA